MPDQIQPGEYSQGSGTDDVLCDSDGDLKLLNANRNDDGSWLNTNYDKPDNRWNRDNGFAFVVSQISSFLLYFMVEEFCFISWPFQPPSMRPISFIFSDSARYFLLSRDLVSQSIKRNTLTASVFRIAIFI